MITQLLRCRYYLIRLSLAAVSLPLDDFSFHDTRHLLRQCLMLRCGVAAPRCHYAIATPATAPA